MSERSGATGRVLLVEDELSIAEPFAQALGRSGFDTTIAPTASEALQLARETDPDVVLLDLTLPDGDGRDVCRELRRASTVPIIMLTARGTVTDRIVGLELGADDCEQLAPAVFRVEDTAEVIGTAPEDTLVQAARGCPAGAISVIDEQTGEQIYP